jgi:hypothetical protein
MTTPSFVTKKILSRLSEVPAFMNQSFGFSGSREPKLKKFSRRRCVRRDKKVIHSYAKNDTTQETIISRPVEYTHSLIGLIVSVSPIENAHLIADTAEVYYPRSLSLERSENGLRSIASTTGFFGGSVSGSHSLSLINHFLFRYRLPTTVRTIGGGSKITFTSLLPHLGHMRRLPSLPRGKLRPLAHTKVCMSKTAWLPHGWTLTGLSMWPRTQRTRTRQLSRYASPSVSIDMRTK